MLLRDLKLALIVGLPDGDAKLQQFVVNLRSGLHRVLAPCV